MSVIDLDKKNCDGIPAALSLEHLYDLLSWLGDWPVEMLVFAFVMHWLGVTLGF
ncbi:hypothetical protein PMIT1327_01158 [Prochlorococcus marinus str. MIT 1327]|nr:hypothetical protein PMIT1312_02276 [Prochlorococcus marinus str. MIT 1312]KZR80714.1 hypothetical protein PMIT1327_01158 [Prochlorococcus marinus str. MIT 1327]